MPEIQAFRGIRYNLGRVGSLSDVVTPPYDVIGPELQEHFYKLHPNRFIRIDLNKIEPGEPLDKNIYELPPEELKKVPSTCYSLEQAIEELEKDKAWLTKGDVFSDDFIAAYLDYKQTAEIAPVKLRPNPVEFELYFHN